MQRETMRHMIIWFLAFVCLIVMTYALRGILLPFVVGILVAYLLDPVADRLEACKMSRQWATLSILGVFFLIFALLIILLGPVLYQQLVDFLKIVPNILGSARQGLEGQLSFLLEKLSDKQVEQVQTMMKEQAQGVSKLLMGVVNNLWKSGLAILNLVSLLVITPLIAFYFLRDWDRMVEKFHQLLPVRHKDTIEEQITRIDQVLSGYLRGQMLVCTLLAIYYAVALSIIGLDYALLIGLSAGFLAFLPYVGTFIGTLTGVGVAWAQYQGWEMVAIVLGVFVFAQFVEGNFITPKIVGDRVGLHPAWIIFGMLAGGVLMGFLGVLIALPVTGVLGVLIRFAISVYKESDLYGGEAA